MSCWSPCAILLADIDRHSIPVTLLHQHLLCVPIAVGEQALLRVKVEQEQMMFEMSPCRVVSSEERIQSSCHQICNNPSASDLIKDFVSSVRSTLCNNVLLPVYTFQSVKTGT